jgi:hypothetical protein
MRLNISLFAKPINPPEVSDFNLQVILFSFKRTQGLPKVLKFESDYFRASSRGVGFLMSTKRLHLLTRDNADSNC